MDQSVLARASRRERPEALLRREPDLWQETRGICLPDRVSTLALRHVAPDVREQLELLVLEEAPLTLGFRGVARLGFRGHTCQLREFARFDRQPEEIAVSLEQDRLPIGAEERLPLAVLCVRESPHAH